MIKRQLISFLSALAIATPALAHPGGVNTPSPDLPPIVPDGVYLSPSDVHARYSAGALEIVLSMLEHRPFAGQPVPPDPVGEKHHFESELRGLVSINGSPPQPILMTGPVDTIAYGRSPGQLGTFDVEMLAMNLTGGPVMIRESPTKQSLGKTSITDIGPPGPGGPPDAGYHIDSFFDVFTELSLDGGMTWIPKSGLRGTRVNLGGVPEPTSVILFALGLVGAAGFVGRRR